MIRKLLRILLLIPVLYILAAPAYLSSSLNSGYCSGVSIDIEDSSDYHFVTKRNLAGLVAGASGRIAGKQVKEVSVSDIEKRIQEMRELRKAEVFISVDGKVHVYADQRNPLMRVVPDEGGDFFVDEDGVLVRKRNLYTPRLHVVGGNITISQSMLNGVSVLDTAIKQTILRDVYHLVKYIRDDSFWSAQIDQIHIDSDNEIDLIPRVGNNLIHFGTIENMEGKLRNLKAFYDDVLPEVGWDRYSLINLEYRDQIVCRKKDNRN